MRKLRNVCVAVLAACLLLSACGTEEPAPVYDTPTEESRTVRDFGKLTILFTADLNNVFAQDTVQGSIGYAALAEYRDQLEDAGHTVVLIDGGDAFSNEGAGLIKDGKTLADLIGAVEYDIRVPGEGEFSFGKDRFLSLSDHMADCTYISCNWMDSTGAAVLDSYVIVECGSIKIGFVGITTPYAADALASDGFDFCQGSRRQDFYDAIQDAIDEASDAGADYVIAVGHLGTDPMDTPWTSAEVIANTTGLTAFLDSHSGAVLEGNTVKDLDNYEIPVCAVGSDFWYVGQITLDLNDGTVEVELLTDLKDQDKTVLQQTEKLESLLRDAE